MQPVVFPALYVAGVKASEKTGEVAEAVKRFIAYRAQADLLRKRVVGAAVYPALIMGVGCLVIAFLLFYVVPRFSVVFQDMGDRVPFMSRLLMAWGRFAQANVWALLLGCAATLLAVAYLAGRPSVRAALARGVMRLPRMGEYVRVYQLARFYRALGMLQQSGIVIVTALEMVAGLLPRSLQPALAGAQRAIREGRAISAALEANGLTTVVSLRLLRVAERSGPHGRDARARRGLPRRRHRAGDRLVHPPVRALADDRHRHRHRHRRAADVRADLRAGGQPAMNLLSEQDVEAEIEAQMLTPSVVRAARERAAIEQRSVPAVLEDDLGLPAERLVRAIGRAMGLRVWASAELAALHPAFELVGYAEAVRRSCLSLRDGEHRHAVIADPFDDALQAWCAERRSPARTSSGWRRWPTSRPIWFATKTRCAPSTPRCLERSRARAATPAAAPRASRSAPSARARASSSSSSTPRSTTRSRAA